MKWSTGGPNTTNPKAVSCSLYGRCIHLECLLLSPIRDKNNPTAAANHFHDLFVFSPTFTFPVGSAQSLSIEGVPHRWLVGTVSRLIGIHSCLKYCTTLHIESAMVRLSDVKAANADFVASLSEPLVGVFVGGTSGICEYALRSLVSNAASVGKSKSRNIDLRIYIVGRNAKAADVTIADCRKLCPQANFTFVRAKDLALLKDVDRVCEEIIKLETAANGPHSKPRVDVLVMSQAGSIFVTRKGSSFLPQVDTAVPLLQGPLLLLLLLLSRHPWSCSMHWADTQNVKAQIRPKDSTISCP